MCVMLLQHPRTLNEQRAGKQMSPCIAWFLCLACVGLHCGGREVLLPACTITTVVIATLCCSRACSFLVGRVNGVQCNYALLTTVFKSRL